MVPPSDTAVNGNGINVMGSYCDLSFDGINILNAKSLVPDDLVAIFQESDRFVREIPETEDDEARKEIVYQAARDVVLKRLDLLGYSTALVQERFEEWRRRQIDFWTEYYNDYPEDGDKETLKAIKAFDFAVWQKRAPRLLEKRWDLVDTEPADETERHLRDHDDGWLYFDGYGSLATLRAMLDVFPNIKRVTLGLMIFPQKSGQG
jgi:hypothetical protein